MRCVALFALVCLAAVAMAHEEEEYMLSQGERSAEQNLSPYAPRAFPRGPAYHARRAAPRRQAQPVPSVISGIYQIRGGDGKVREYKLKNVGGRLVFEQVLPSSTPRPSLVDVQQKVAQEEDQQVQTQQEEDSQVQQAVDDNVQQVQTQQETQEEVNEPQTQQTQQELDQDVQQQSQQEEDQQVQQEEQQQVQEQAVKTPVVQAAKGREPVKGHRVPPSKGHQPAAKGVPEQSTKSVVQQQEAKGEAKGVQQPTKTVVQQQEAKGEAKGVQVQQQEAKGGVVQQQEAKGEAKGVQQREESTKGGVQQREESVKGQSPAKGHPGVRKLPPRPVYGLPKGLARPVNKGVVQGVRQGYGNVVYLLQQPAYQAYSYPYQVQTISIADVPQPAYSPYVAAPSYPVYGSYSYGYQAPPPASYPVVYGYGKK